MVILRAIQHNRLLGSVLDKVVYDEFGITTLDQAFLNNIIFDPLFLFYYHTLVINSTIISSWTYEQLLKHQIERHINVIHKRSSHVIELENTPFQNPLLSCGFIYDAV